MTYYFAAYLVFFAALFGYLAWLTRRQARLVVRAEALVARLVARSGADRAAPGDGS